MPRISESDLIIPALKIMDRFPNGTISTTNLITELTIMLKPTGEDLDILDKRNDTKFSQKVRNLKSHNTMSGLAIYTPSVRQGESGTFTITNEGKSFLNRNINK